MTYATNCPKQISIDRIDPKQGYIKGNVQLLCRWVNLAKQNFDNKTIKELLEESFKEMVIDPKTL